MTHATPKFFCVLNNTDRAYLVEMPSKFTLLEANYSKKLLQKLCKTKSKIKKIILDFAHTINMDSNGLLGLCQIVQIAKNSEINLTFGSFSPQVKIILSLAGLEKLFISEENINISNTENNHQQIKIHPAVISKSKRLLDICGAIVGLSITGILIIPIALTNCTQKNL